MKKILIINGHPDKSSFNHALAKAYWEGAQASHGEISQINIGELDFSPNLAFGYRKRTDWEPDLVDAVQKLKDADHLVWVFPMWWSGVPAIMKGFIDRTFLPGITFEQIEGKPLPRKLLKGTTARIIMTADSPRWYDRLFMHSAAINQFKKGTLEFCGVSPVKVTYLPMIKDSTPALREKWLKKVHDLGLKLR
jgi:putative NADPH-quinone reductase